MLYDRTPTLESFTFDACRLLLYTLALATQTVLGPVDLTKTNNNNNNIRTISEHVFILYSEMCRRVSVRSMRPARQRITNERDTNFEFKNYCMETNTGK